MSNAFMIKEAISFGWRTFKAHPWVFVKVSLAYLAVQFVLGIVENMLPEFLSPVVSIVVGTFLGIGIIAFYLKAHDSPAQASWKLLWTPEPFWRYLVTSMIAGVLIMIGFVFFIIPGVILALAWSFALYLVIERKMWTMEALKESARLTRGSRVKLFLFGLTLALLNLLGAIVLLVGLFVSIPVTLLASVHVYRALQAKPAEKPAETTLDTVAPAPAA